MRLHGYVYGLCVCVVALMAFHTATAQDLVPPPDPRILSEIPVERQHDCDTDASNDGKLLYTICDSSVEPDKATSEDSTRFYIHDISDLQHPQLLSTLVLNPTRNGRLIVRNGTAFYQQAGGKGITLIDVRDPSAPQMAGYIKEHDSEFIVSDDGQSLTLRREEYYPDPDSYVYSYFDTSDPYHPKPDTAQQTQLPVAIKWIRDTHDIFQSRINIEGILWPVRMEDIRGTFALLELDHSNKLHLYDLSVSGSPKLVSIFPSAHIDYYNYKKIIPNTQAVISGDNNTAYNHPSKNFIEIRSTAPVPFDSQRLIDYYHYAVQKRPSCISHNSGCYNLIQEMLVNLQDYGIEQLINEQPDGITTDERIAMLTDYGVWLDDGNRHRPDKMQRSVAALRKVTELTPYSAVAWHNLGDALHSYVKQATTDSEKAVLWDDARRAYRHYNKFAGKPKSARTPVSTFDLPRYVETAKDVCTYVARAENANRREDISSPWGRVTADGKTTYFEVGAEDGGCSIPVIRSSKCLDSECMDDEERLSPFSFAGDEHATAVFIVPFNGTYYTAAATARGITEVVDPTKGQVCGFDHRYTPKLVINKKPALCRKLLKDRLEPNIAWSPVNSAITNDTDNASTFDNGNAPTATVEFTPKSSAQVVHFSGGDHSKCPCIYSGIALLDHNSFADNTLNQSLIKNQQKWWSCGDADADLVKVGDTTYVEAWAGDVAGRPQSPRVLLQMVADKFEPVCRVDMVRTEIPHAVHP